MANLCTSLIAEDINFACDDLVVRGLESDGIIINRDDIDFAATTFDSTKPNVIKSLVLKSGKKGYEVQQQGATPFTGTQSALTVGTYRNTWQHTVSLVVLANEPDVNAKIIDGLANGTFVVILRNVSKGATGDGEYQVYGYLQGLKASEITNEKYSEDTDGGWLVNLQESASPRSALFFFDTDSATTATAYASLLTTKP